MNWQKAFGYNQRSKVEVTISRYKIAVKVLNRMMELGPPVCVRVA